MAILVVQNYSGRFGKASDLVQYFHMRADRCTVRYFDRESRSNDLASACNVGVRWRNAWSSRPGPSLLNNGNYLLKHERLEILEFKELKLECTCLPNPVRCFLEMASARLPVDPRCYRSKLVESSLARGIFKTAASKQGERLTCRKHHTSFVQLSAELTLDVKSNAALSLHFAPSR